MQAMTGRSAGPSDFDEAPLMTSKDVCQFTRLGRTTVWEAIQRGELPVIRFGRAMRFRRTAVDTWIARREIGGEAL